MVTVAIATNAIVFAKIYTEASTRLKGQASSAVSPAIRAELKMIANTKASEQAMIKAISQTQTLAQSEIRALTQVLNSTQALTATIVSTMAQAITKSITEAQPLTKTQVETKVETATKTITDPAIKEAVQTKVQTLIKTEVKPAEKVKDKVKVYKPITINLKEGKVTLTAAQVAGSVGWKQGIMYWLLYPPYKKQNYIATRKPIKGIPYTEGIGSAYRSLIRIGGVLPKEILRDMGIMDIRITTTGKKPTMKFKRDVGQKTTTTGTGIKVVKR